MAKKQITMQLSTEVLDKVEREAKKTKKPKQVIVDERLKQAYGI